MIPHRTLPARLSGALPASLLAASAALAHGPAGFDGDAPPRFDAGGIVAAAAQCQQIVDGDADDDCSAALLAQPELSFQPTARDLFFLKAGFASSNLLNKRTPLTSSPWAADLEDDVESINDTGRDYLLTAWYRHDFVFGRGNGLGVVVGLIDATDLLDENEFANDEFTQFMNSALVNGPNTLLPSYDPGVAVDWHLGSWSLHGVYMNIDGEETSSDTGFYAFQAAWHPRTRFGQGNYRLILTRTGRGFLDPEGLHRERREDVIISLDQAFGERLGVYARIEMQEDNAAVVAKSTWSSGVQIRGHSWGRAQDTAGVAFIYAEGGNLELRDGYGGELYYRHAITEVLAVTGDVQYGYNDLSAGDDVEAWHFGLRLTAEF